MAAPLGGQRWEVASLSQTVSSRASDISPECPLLQSQDSGEFQTPLGKAQLGVGVVCAADLGMGFIVLLRALFCELRFRG